MEACVVKKLSNLGQLIEYERTYDELKSLISTNKYDVLYVQY